MNILEIKDLSKSYTVNKRQNHILKNINMSIKKGEFISIMGPSGSGKSTLLYSVSGMDNISSGEVIFSGEHISSFPKDRLADFRLKNMGFIFQHSHLLQNLNILDNIIIPGFLAKSEKKSNVKNYALELMDKTGIRELIHHDISQVSGGELQRAAVCRSLINRPEILFADEPTGALNSSSSDQIIEILTDFNRLGTTIMVVTHDVKVAAKTERILFIKDGKIEGEKFLGKLEDNSDLKNREISLNGWLIELGW